MYFLKATNNALAPNIKNLEKCQYQYENHPSDFPMSQIKLNKRISDIQGVTKRYQDMSSEYSGAINASQRQSEVSEDLESGPAQREEDGEFADTRGLDTKEVI